MTASCWLPRHLALGFADQTDAMLAYLDEHGYEALDALAAGAGYDVSEEAARRDGGAYWLWEVMGDICLLDAGHPGPHEFSRTRDVVLTFKGDD
jgi:hypothetical protein